MIVINIEKAKDIGHTIRREKREEEFKPYDDAIAKQIPNQFENAELARQAIREKYAQIQIQIDAASTADEIKVALQLN